MYCPECRQQICVYNSGGVSGNRGSVQLENKIKIAYTINSNETNRPHEFALINSSRFGVTSHGSNGTMFQK